MKPSKLIVPTVLLCAMAQVNATMMQYNTSNQMVRSGDQTMSYSPRGDLKSVDNVNLIHGATFIEQSRSMTSTVFGGVRLLSNGVTQSIFTDNQSTLKTASADNIQHSYTDPYGNAVLTPKTKGGSYPLESNRMTFDGGYQINGDLINFGARSYLPSIKRFTSNDSYDVPNRYNFSDGNPVMKFDPSGHDAKSVLNLIGNITVGVEIGNLLLGDDKEMSAATKNALVGVVVGVLLAGIGSLVYLKLREGAGEARGWGNFISHSSGRSSSPDRRMSLINQLSENNSSIISGKSERESILLKSDSHISSEPENEDNIITESLLLGSDNENIPPKNKVFGGEDISLSSKPEDNNGNSGGESSSNEPMSYESMTLAERKKERRIRDIISGKRKIKRVNGVIETYNPSIKTNSSFEEPVIKRHSKLPFYCCDYKLKQSNSLNSSLASLHSNATSRLESLMNNRNLHQIGGEEVGIRKIGSEVGVGSVEGKKRFDFDFDSDSDSFDLDYYREDL